MCTAIHWTSAHHYFGRNLDLEYSYHETVTITPRHFPIHFRNTEILDFHYAIIGMATVIENYPLYYDATNECGLSIAALNFPGNAHYGEQQKGMVSIAPFEFIPWILSRCANLHEAKENIQNLHFVNEPFNKDLPNTPLHWMISDKTGSIVIESTKSGCHIYQNPVNVLTNNPPFDFHLHNLCNYMGLSPEQSKNQFSSIPDLQHYSFGMGAIGLPGDLSSASRFIRAAYTLENASKYSDETSAVHQFFQILGTVSQTEGCVKTPNGLEKTLYSSCCNTDLGIYYYTTYSNKQITAVRMNKDNMNSEHLTCYPLRWKAQIKYETVPL